MVTKNELCGRLPTLDRSALNHEKRNVAIKCNPQGLAGKYLTITSSFQTSCTTTDQSIPWSINEILVQTTTTIQDYSDVYGECNASNFEIAQGDPLNIDSLHALKSGGGQSLIPHEILWFHVW